MNSSEFVYRNGVLACEGVELTQVADTHGTPAYVYSKAAILNCFRAYEEALAGLPHRICYSVKANSNLAVLAILAKAGAGFDIVSGGELYRVIAAGGDVSSVVFSGVGKTEAEIRYALERGIHSFNCESEAEIKTISRIATELGRRACIAIRVNPDVDAITHPYISTGLREHKFGIDISAAESIYRYAATLPGIAVEGVSCHIGSQLLDTGPLADAAAKVFTLIERLRETGIGIRHVDLGGGLGVPYRSTERAALPRDLFMQLKPRIESLGLMIMVEPGRSIIAEAGVLLTRVLLVKKNGPKTFIIVDAGMNDLIRPALYEAYHEIAPVREAVADAEIQAGEIQADEIQADIVGPVCESGDFFARNRNMPMVRAGDLLAIRTAGAYGFVSSSNYNSRPRPCELLVDGAEVRLARKRETFADLIRGELPAS